MIWTTVSFCVVGLWAMLAVFGGERKRQVQEEQLRADQEESQSIASKDDQPPTVVR